MVHQCASAIHALLCTQDNTLRMWDMRPFAPANRCTKVFTGHQHNFEQNLLKCDWSPDGSRVRGLSAGCLKKRQMSWLL